MSKDFQEIKKYLLYLGIWTFALFMALLKALIAWRPAQYQTLVFGVGFALPGILIIYCYANIYKEVRGICSLDHFSKHLNLLCPEIYF